MMNNRWILSIVVSLVGFTGAVDAATVYDNTANNLNTRLGAGTVEIADEIILGGTERSLSAFSFQYYLLSPTPGGETLRLRFYQQNGVSGQPGSLLFDSGFFSVPATSGSSVEITDFSTGATLPFTSLLPDQFTWSVTFNGVGAGESAGVNLFGPPTVGNSIVDYWENNGAAWINKRVDFGFLPNPGTDFAATVQAVPEPSVIALVVIGGAAVVWRRSRRATNGGA